MSKSSRSYLKVPYDLRPAKQVERRIILDILQKLTRIGFPIPDYQYTGMGSIHFVDYVLFHKVLEIKKMWSVENSMEIERRVRFNKPFEFIKIKMQSMSDVIPTLSTDAKHILWMDYDTLLCNEILQDLRLAMSRLSVGSMIILTVDTEPPGQDSDGPREWKKYFESEAGQYLAETKLMHFKKSNLVRLNIEILRRTINAGLLGREAQFIPLFNFLYADGHQMLSLGGIIGTETQEKQLHSSDLARQTYIRFDLALDPFPIVVPVLTRKERFHLDSAMPCRDGWVPREFELSADSVATYRDVYRFLPAYAEIVF